MTGSDHDFQYENILKYVLSLLPDSLKDVCRNYLYAYHDISEVRLRNGGPLSFTCFGANLTTKIVCNKDDIMFCVDKMTDGNYTKYDSLMKTGVITLSYGCRAGVCGTVFSEENRVKTVISVDYICLRFPSVILCGNEKILNHLDAHGLHAGLLVFSPPGGGKTTVLRSLAYQLSSEPYFKRVAVVDTLGELRLPFPYSARLCDFLTGYPKPAGIRSACRFLSPEYVICDEICGKEEAEAILDVQNVGIPLAASAHAGSFSELRRNKSLRLLLENGVFGAAVRLSRTGKTVDCEIRDVTEILK